MKGLKVFCLFGLILVLSGLFWIAAPGPVSAIEIYQGSNGTPRNVSRNATAGIWDPTIQIYHELSGSTSVSTESKDHVYYRPISDNWWTLNDLELDHDEGEVITVDAAMVGSNGDIFYCAGADGTTDYLRPRRWHVNETIDEYAYIPITDDPRHVITFQTTDDSLLHVLVLTTVTSAFGYDYTHSASQYDSDHDPIEDENYPWTANGNQGSFFCNVPYVTCVFLNGVHYWFGFGVPANYPGFKFTEATNTYAALTETSRPASPWIGKAFVVYNGAIYGVFCNTLFNSAQVWTYNTSTSTWSLYRNDLVIPSGLYDNEANINKCGSFVYGEYIYIMQPKMGGAIASYGSASVVKIHAFGSSVRRVVGQTNPAYTTGTAGTITSITWEGPRCMFSDESLSVKVTGTVNTPFVLQLVSDEAVVLAAVSDRTRTGGLYYWLRDLPNSFSGFVYVIDTVSGVRSSWGYIALAPAASQAQNSISCEYTSSDQMEHPFSDWVVGPNDLMICYWRTDLLAADLANYTFAYWYGGNSDSVLYYKTLGWLETNYYQIGYASNLGLGGWRFILGMMNPGAGADTYDGLVLDFSNPLSVGTAGIYVPVVVDSVSTEKTTTVSSYWYGSYRAESGLVGTLNKSVFKPGENIVATCQINDETGIFDYFADIDASVYSAADVLKSGVDAQELDVMVGVYRFDLVAPLVAGDYYVLIWLAGDDLDYEQSLRLVFSVSVLGASGGSGGGTSGWSLGLGGLGDGVDNLFEVIGADNTVGKLVLMLLVMLLVFFLARKDKTMRVVFPLVVLGLWIVLGWVDVWVVVLLGLGAGLTIWKFVSGRGGSHD